MMLPLLLLAVLWVPCTITAREGGRVDAEAALRCGKLLCKARGSELELLHAETHAHATQGCTEPPHPEPGVGRARHTGDGSARAKCTAVECAHGRASVTACIHAPRVMTGRLSGGGGTCGHGSFLCTRLRLHQALRLQLRGRLRLHNALSLRLRRRGDGRLTATLCLVGLRLQLAVQGPGAPSVHDWVSRHIRLAAAVLRLGSTFCRSASLRRALAAARAALLLAVLANLPGFLLALVSTWYWGWQRRSR